MTKKLILMSLAAVALFVLVPQAALAQCEEECWHNQTGSGQHLGYACIEGEEGELCEATYNTCIIDLCKVEPVAILNSLGLPSLVVQSCPATVPSALDFDVPVLFLNTESTVDPKAAEVSIAEKPILAAEVRGGSG